VDRTPASGEETTTAYTFMAVTKDDGEAHIRALLVQSMTGTSFQLQSVSSRNSSVEGYVEVRADLLTETRDDKQMESAVSRLSMEPQVTSVRWTARATRNSASRDDD
jgi:putative Mg2+ transporter-C (MgtC) family protein